MKIEETYYGVVLRNKRTPEKVFIAFGEGCAPQLFKKRRGAGGADEFKRGLVTAGCKNAKVVKIIATYEFTVG